MIDKAKIEALHSELNSVLAAFAEKNGLKASRFNIRYSATSFVVSNVTFGEKDAFGGTDPKYAANLKRNELFLFGQRVYLKSVDLNGDTLQIEGLRGKKVLVRAMKLGGKTKLALNNTYTLPIDRTVALLNKTVTLSQAV